jgi:hypothetical protein
MSEHRFAGWNPFDDSHVKHDNEICTIMNCKDIQDESIDIEEVFEPEDCTMVMEAYGPCHDYICDECALRFKQNYCTSCELEHKGNHKDGDGVDLG